MSVARNFQNVKYTKTVNEKSVTVSGELRVIFETFNLRIEFWNKEDSRLIEVPINQISESNGIQVSKQKPKIKLSLVNNVFYIFSCDSNSQRDKIKAKIFEVIKYGKVVSGLSEEEKLRMAAISSNKTLNSLYSTLVNKEKVLTKKEFWKDRKYLYTVSQENQNTGTILGLEDEVFPNSEKKKKDTTTRATLSQIKITPMLIKQLFQSYPGLRKTYHHLVPTKISEREFWIKFTHSSYFYRIKAKLDGGIEKDEIDTIFEENRQTGNKRLEKQLGKIEKFPDFDVSKNLNDNYVGYGYGLRTNDFLGERINHEEEENKLLEEQNTLSYGAIRRMSGLMDPRKAQSLVTDLIPSEKNYSVLNVKEFENKEIYFTNRIAKHSADLLENKEININNFKLQIHKLSNSDFNSNITEKQKIFDGVSNDINYQSKIAGLDNIHNMQNANKQIPEQELFFAQFDIVYELLKHYWSANPLSKKKTTKMSAILKAKIKKIVVLLEKKKKLFQEFQSEHGAFSRTFDPVIIALEKALSHYKQKYGGGNQRKVEQIGISLNVGRKANPGRITGKKRAPSFNLQTSVNKRIKR